MHDRPHRLRDQVRVVELLPQRALLRELVDEREEHDVRVLSRIHRLVALGRLRRRLGQEHQAKLLGELPSEVEVREPDPRQALHRVGDVSDLEEALGEAREVLPAELAKQRFLVREVAVERGRRVIDALGDLAHGHGLVAALGEELARRVQDFLPELEAFPLAALAAAHNDVDLVNNVKNVNAVRIFSRFRGGGPSQRQ